jgi:hypothetical protein
MFLSCSIRDIANHQLCANLPAPLDNVDARVTAITTLRAVWNYLGPEVTFTHILAKGWTYDDMMGIGSAIVARPKNLPKLTITDLDDALQVMQRTIGQRQIKVALKDRAEAWKSRFGLGTDQAALKRWKASPTMQAQARHIRNAAGNARRRKEKKARAAAAVAVAVAVATAKRKKQNVDTPRKTKTVKTQHNEEITSKATTTKEKRGKAQGQQAKQNAHAICKQKAAADEPNDLALDVDDLDLCTLSEDCRAHIADKLREYELPALQNGPCGQQWVLNPLLVQLSATL